MGGGKGGSDFSPRGKSDAEFLVSAADESSGEIGIDASYSGRCMYGQTCLGLTFENIQSAFGLFESLRYFGSSNFVNLTHELADFLAGCSKDGYGIRSVNADFSGTFVRSRNQKFGQFNRNCITHKNLQKKKRRLPLAEISPRKG